MDKSRYKGEKTTIKVTTGNKTTFVEELIEF
jgi:hypothetical protein